MRAQYTKMPRVDHGRMSRNDERPVYGHRIDKSRIRPKLYYPPAIPETGPTNEFYRRALVLTDPESSRERELLKTSGSGAMRRAVTAVAIAAVCAATSVKDTFAKPGPFYRGNSLFTYSLRFQTEGMNGQMTPFSVDEIGASFHVPVISETKTGRGGKPVKSEKFGITLMALGGMTRCEGVPMAESNFGKVALVLNNSFKLGGGTLSTDVGARKMFVKTLGCTFIAPGTENLPMGPVFVEIPSQNFADWDFGAKAEWSRGHGKKGAIQSLGARATLFDTNEKIRENRVQWGASVGLQGGWGLSLSGDTRSNDLGVMGEKAFMLGKERGKYMLFVGAGADIGTESFTGYLGAKLGPVMVLPMYAAEAGEKSFHLLLTANTGEIYRAIWKAEK